jgi:4-amino-4-deoxy-L-arabinose transferase-like glycosyltransferase
MRRRDAAVLFLAGAAFFLPALASRDVWQSLESRYAAVAREMAEDGDWLVPRFNGEVYADKPPLFLWCGAALHAIGCGVNGLRVFAALVAAATLVVTAALGRLFFSRRAALLGAAILATTPLFAWKGRFGELDVPLALLTTIAAYGWFAGGRRVALFYVAMGLAVLGKGPAGVAVPLLAVLAGHLARVRPSSPRAPLHLAWGPLVAAGPPALWFFAALARAPNGYAREILGRHVVTRITEPWIHDEPPWYFLTEGSPWLLPWLLVAIPAGAWAWRRRREEAAPAMLLLWFVLGSLLFSALPGKRVAYLLPLAPALALLAARGIEATATQTLERALHLAAAAAGLLLVAFGLGAGDSVLRGLRIAPWLGDALAPATRLPGGATVAAGGLVLTALALAGARRPRAWILVAEVALGFAITDLALSPRLDTVRSPRAISARIDAMLPPGTGEVAMHPDDFLGLLHLYSDRRRFPLLTTEDGIAAFLAVPGPRLVVTRSMPFPVPPDVHAVRAGRIGAREIEVRSLTPFNERR